MSALPCAIYTRKSSEEGLEQGFNSLDAQREDCEAYILSQKSQGWKLMGAFEQAHDGIETAVRIRQPLSVADGELDRTSACLDRRFAKHRRRDVDGHYPAAAADPVRRSDGGIARPVAPSSSTCVPWPTPATARIRAYTIR